MKSKLIFILYFALALSATGQHATWDLSDIDLNDKKVNVKYVADKKYENGIIGIEHHGLSYYEVEQGRI